ncbi:hypothetical protein CLFE_034540 [Clostridium felsineum DSM 794]|nr:hypothetical protein CLFE_034540 [Clostridium felsineum DSM 794]
MGREMDLAYYKVSKTSLKLVLETLSIFGTLLLIDNFKIRL